MKWYAFSYYNSRDILTSTWSIQSQGAEPQYVDEDFPQILERIGRIVDERPTARVVSLGDTLLVLVPELSKPVGATLYERRLLDYGLSPEQIQAVHAVTDMTCRNCQDADAGCHCENDE